MRRVWPDTVVEEGNLTFNISSLRKTLGDDPRRHEYIVTIPGEGYKFVAGVRAAFDELIVRESTSITIEEGEEISAPNEIDEIAAPGVRAVNGVSRNVAMTARAPSNVVPDASRERHRSTKPLMIAALLVVGVITLLSLYWFIIHRQSGARTVAAIPFREMEIARLTTSGKITHAAISPDGKYVASVVSDADGNSLWVRNVVAPSNVRIAGPAVTEYISVTFAPDGNSVYYIALDHDKGESTLYRVPTLGGPSSILANDIYPIGFAPDGRQIAFIRFRQSESHLVVADSNGANQHDLATRQKPDSFELEWNAPAWSPDGKRIACPARLNDQRGHYATIIVVNSADGTQSLLTSRRWTYVGQPVWLADSSGVLLPASDGPGSPMQVWYVNSNDGVATRITHDLNDYHDLSVTTDASRLTAVQDQGVSSIWVAPEADAARAKQISSEIGGLEVLAWTPDGQIVYRSSAGGTGADIWIMKGGDSDARQLTVGPRAGRGLRAARDGR